MTPAKRLKVVYLLGAGATHGELINLAPELHRERKGLLIGDVSSRVIDEARKDKRYLQNLEMVSGTAGSLNIELLISLIENSKIHDWAYKTELLKRLVEEDIKRVLTAARLKKFYLHRALFELHHHQTVSKREMLLGVISLNYDGVLDAAYREYYGEPNYSFTLDGDESNPSAIPLLKLHGSFNWSDKAIHGRKSPIAIIPLGANKTYLHAPYGFIWSRALEILTHCDCLRVIGCSLSQNDAHLTDLLFKAHLERLAPFEIEVIAPTYVGEGIQKNYGFFPKITTLRDIERNLIPERDPENPFKTWLKYKSLKSLPSPRALRATTHVRRVAELSGA